MPSARATLLAAAAALLLSPVAAHATTIAVTTTQDEVAADGKCSLREAILAVDSGNSGPGGDCAVAGGSISIQLPAGEYKLTIVPNGFNNGSGGAVDITAPVSVVGAGAGTTAIHEMQQDRVIKSTAAGVKIFGLTVKGGTETTTANGLGIDNEGASAS